ncbi:Uncharacterized protein FWK35_00031966 [Aphis craccivora]|uniref:Uncharacterized protein n=1 Tax=Aphis craccivora TaxID=307492 RepID=A0A6G0YBT6_APHCR|nr:Uncharacterized protein FWK35_00031966 [Aphis craccivora]
MYIIILFVTTEVNKRKRKRVKVECLVPGGSKFNDGFNKKHKEKLYHGKRHIVNKITYKNLTQHINE